MNKKFLLTAKDVINLEIKALQNLKRSLNNSFNEAVFHIAKCQSKVILCCVTPPTTDNPVTNAPVFSQSAKEIVFFSYHLTFSFHIN